MINVSIYYLKLEWLFYLKQKNSYNSWFFNILKIFNVFNVLAILFIFSLIEFRIILTINFKILVFHRIWSWMITIITYFWKLWLLSQILNNLRRSRWIKLLLLCCLKLFLIWKLYSHCLEYLIILAKKWIVISLRAGLLYLRFWYFGFWFYEESHSLVDMVT